jgi:hypothetical protein
MIPFRTCGLAAAPRQNLDAIGACMGRRALINRGNHRFCRSRFGSNIRRWAHIGGAYTRPNENAGFREIRLKTPSLAMVLEGGLEQAVRAFTATPDSLGVAALGQEVQDTPGQ